MYKLLTGDDIVDLRDLKGQEMEDWQKAIEDQTGYNFDDLKDNEPIMIRDSYFTEYAQELADDIGAIDKNATWPLNCIDWEQASDELLNDYSEVTVNDITYYFRSF
jgi:hypothetical protein